MIVRFLRHAALITAFIFLNLHLFSQTTVYQKDKWGAKLYYFDETNTMRIKDKWGDKLTHDKFYNANYSLKGAFVLDRKREENV